MKENQFDVLYLRLRSVCDDANKQITKIFQKPPDMGIKIYLHMYVRMYVHVASTINNQQ